MAKAEAVWCIDLGNASLKALRCRRGERSDQVVAEAFDFIEYPKILSQPGAEPSELIAEALKQFLSRNSVKNCQVAVAVSGQNGLARFIKLPPIEPKRIPDIVRYEARQQIPFDLDEVIWSYERMAGGMEEEGFVLEAEIGLFAMKRDQVYRALEPFRKGGIEVDIVQLSPLALYNFLAFELAEELPTPQEYDPDSPPPYYVIVSMGTDASDLVITNGFRVWQRSVPLGGNHFTRALTRELKLTFAKAEHEKRNAMAAADPRAVFQAMRPVFNDLLTEIQRSIAYFSSINRTATISHVVPLGNAMRLPGLQRYLGQMLDYRVVGFERFQHLAGPEVVGAPAFHDNRLTFAACYGLAVQGLGRGRVNTNLLPSEIVRDRLIRAKKPWAVAAAAVLLLAFTISFSSFSRALGTMDKAIFGNAEQAASQIVARSRDLQQQKSQIDSGFEETNQVGKNLVGHVEGRVRWLELLRALNECLPRDPEGQRPAEIDQRNELYITNLESQFLPDVSQWFAVMKANKWYLSDDAASAAGDTPMSPDGAAGPAAPAVPGPAAASPMGSTPMAPPGMPTSMAGAPMASGPMAGNPMVGNPGGASPLPGALGQVDVSDGPSGEGYVIQLTGFHYHNRPTAGGIQGARYVRETLIRNLREGRVLLPKVDEQGVELVSMKDLGIGYPVLINPGKIYKVTIPRPGARLSGGAYMSGSQYMGGEESDYSSMPMMPQAMSPMASGMLPGVPGSGTPPEQQMLELWRFDFVVQFSWQPKSPTERHAQKEQQQQAEQPLQPAAAPASGQSPPVQPPTSS